MREGGQHTRRGHAGAIASGLLFIALVLYITAFPYPTFDTVVTHSVYNWPLGLRPLFILITQLSSGWAVLILVVWSLIKLQHKVAAQLLSACAGSFVIVELVKHIVARQRPYNSIAGIVARDPLTPGGFGFPSGHATIAIVLGLFLATQLPKKWRFAIVFGIALIGISRVYLGMHTPLDVIGGYLLGAALGLAIFGRDLLAKTSRKA